MDHPFSTQLQKWQFVDKYSRWNYEHGRRETWEEAINRSVEYLREISENKLDEKDYQDIFNAMYNMEAFCSMRLFAMAGDAARRDNTVLYNCSYLPVDSIESMSEALYLSMSGCGVGYSVERRYIEKLPTVQDQAEDTLFWTIADTQAGWAEAFLAGLNQWFNGGNMEFDFSEIRPAGTVLKTKGGRASGHEVLKDLLNRSMEIISNAQGRKLTPIEVHDIMTSIGDCARSGGSRRSAMICLFDSDDNDMLHAKDYGWWKVAPQRANANNSIVIEGNLTKDELTSIMNTMNNGGSGEPGFFIRQNALAFAPRRKAGFTFGTNPCQPGFATVLTENGIKLMDDINVGDYVWSQDGFVKIVNKVHTGNKPVYEYMTTGGRFVGTDTHRIVSNGDKIEVCNAESIDLLPFDMTRKLRINEQDIVDGLVIGDGSVHMQSAEKVYLIIGQNDHDYHDSEIKEFLVEPHAVKYDNAWKVKTTITIDELPHTYNRVIPDRFYYGSQDKVCSFLRGLYSANGTVVHGRVVLKAVSFELIKQVQDMLSSVGVRSYYTTNKESLVKHSNGEYLSKQSYDLNITSDRKLFMDNIGFIQKYKTKKLVDACNNISAKTGTKTHDIIDIQYLGDFDVYDITVDGNSHTYWSSCLNVSNCGEIMLREFQFCNLTQAITRSNDTIGSLKEKVRIATIIGTIQSMATNFKFIRDIWRQNTEEERLLGVDITGQLDAPHLFTNESLRQLKQTAIETNREYSEKLGINQSVAVTCNKPSGNSSILFNCSAGLHSRWSDYYIRRVRVDVHSPFKTLFDFSGVKLFPENGQQAETANTFVAEFPMKAPDGAITNGSRSAIEQLEWWKMNKTNWTEHNPSITISYKSNELPEMIHWLYKNQGIIGGLSFLPYDDHTYPLAPYERIDKETYERMVSEMPNIDFNLLHLLESEDNTTVAQELACVSGICEI